MLDAWGEAAKRFGLLPFGLKVCFVAMVGMIGLNLAVFIFQYPGIHIDQGLATLVAAAVGIAVVGFQTNKGFANLIHSQANQAQLDRDARDHAADLDDKAHARRDAKEKAYLLSALRAEIVALHASAGDHRERAANFALGYQAFVKAGAADTVRSLSSPVLDAPIFRANVEKLGLLGPNLGADIIKVLSRANGKPVEPTPATQPFPNKFVCQFYEAQETYFAKWAADLYHVAMRIRAEEDGTPDPGTLAHTQEARYNEMILISKA
jgi:hypothetical protein